MSETHSHAGWPQPYRLLDAEPYWQGLEQELLKYQRCTSCALAVWPAHSHCPHCASRALAWEVSSGRGTLYSFSTVMRGPTSVWTSIVPYTVGFVEMAEGYYLFAQIDGSPEAMQVGKPARVRFDRRGAQVLPIFVLQ
jgi:uncharacterized OB-fold protein